MKVLIVDDEVIIRTGLSTVINWEDSGFKVLHPAASAEEALARIPEEQPDIIFTDIRMTGMSGLDLAREVRGAQLDTEMIVISGFDEFVYAQQAMREGISEYLLKTSRPDEILQAAVRAQGRIEQRKHENEIGRAQQRSESRNLLRGILMSASPPEDQVFMELEKRYPELRTKEGSHLLQVWMITSRNHDEKGDIPESLYASLGERLLELLPCGCEWIPWNHALLLIVRIETDREHHNMLEYTIRRAGEELGIKTFAACGRSTAELKGLRQAFETAAETGRYEWLLTKESVRYEQICGRKGVKPVCTLDEEKEMAAWLRAEDDTILTKGIAELLDRLRMDQEATPGSVQAYLQTLIVAGYRWVERAAQSMGQSYAPPSGENLDLRELARRPEKVLLHHFRLLIKQHAELVSDISPVQQAITYIHEHLGQGVSLQQVAKHVHMNSNYFSELFKRETGKNYIEYVTEVKMRLAMELLTDTHSKISEIAHKVGYEDLKYFNRLFKKFTGVTPSEYRAKAEIYPSVN